MKIVKTILVLILLICIPATTFAALYQDQNNNFQINVPDNWITNQNNAFSKNTFVINHPLIKRVSIVMKVSKDVANSDPNKTFDDYSKQDIITLVATLKTEISNSIPKIKFQNAKTCYYAKNKTIQLYYTDGSTEYCLTEFLLQGKIFMLIFTAPTQEYAHLSPIFFNMLESIKTIFPPNNELSQLNIPTV